MNENAFQTIVLGGGCFWCVEAAFLEIRGVKSVLPGYAGGEMHNPTYHDVCTGQTGHAEVVKVSFDPKEVELNIILKLFFGMHDPTSLNRQGNDVGTQYRSIILYQDEAQKEIAESVMKEVDQGLPMKITTELSSLSTFYPAEENHHQYYANNLEKPYCMLVVSPKLNAFREKYRDKLVE
ncbi:peptide-methionine (S)-S-oxide reductase MsrA [Algicola sagamiensis]|uniref:peptide-methionine (S)-S-oxide reductase MsrA n=1 Tax=Algicola sagamiensis TaxID=163869 RepID=UPI00036203F1|nr:peptide-methionine (S)-S-oxide reductase MsrA [Algicola sagamiensis]